MRKVFSSQRLENVEAVAKLLEDDGIEVRIENPRSFRSAIRGNFSYRDDGKPKPAQPSVWVVRSDDQPRARALLRTAGLLQDTTRDPVVGLNFTARNEVPSKKRISRLRYGLLALVIIAAAANFIRRPAELPVSGDATSATIPPALRMLDETIDLGDAVHVIATPPMLAVMLARRMLEMYPAHILCLAIDGRDPPATALTALTATGIHAHPDSACPSTDDTLRLDVHDYTTDGSGSGEVSLNMRHGTPQLANIETVPVRRTGEVWAVLPDAH